MLRAILDTIRPPEIVDSLAFRRFVSGEASYLAQRSTYEFSRNTLAYFGQWAFHDDRFNEAFRVCRWESFAAILADMTIVAAGHLRGAAADYHRGLDAILVELYAAMLGEYETPAHRPQGWEDQVNILGNRLALTPAALPPPAGEVARVSAKRVYDVLPVYSPATESDIKTIENAIRFGVIAFDARLRKRVRLPVVVEALTSGR